MPDENEEIQKAAPEHAAMLELMKKELLLIFLKRLGGEVSISLKEMDATKGDTLSFHIDDDNVFHFSIGKLK